MRLLLDEHFPASVATALRARGHDAVAVVERAGWRGLDDARLFVLACEEQRAVVTRDVKDFRPLALHALVSGHGHFGVVFVARSLGGRDPGPLLKALQELLAAHPAEGPGRNREFWLTSPQ